MQDVDLHKSLNAFQLWGIAVGLVVSGEYFGWSYGWPTAGTLGFLITTAVVAAMYIAFIFSFTELTTAIPQSVGRPPLACLGMRSERGSDAEPGPAAARE